MCTVILNSFMKLLLSNYYVPNSQLSANNAKMNSLKYLQNAYYVPSTFLSTEDTAVNNFNKDLCPLEAHALECTLQVHSKEKSFNKVSEIGRIQLVIRGVEENKAEKGDEHVRGVEQLQLQVARKISLRQMMNFG